MRQSRVPPQAPASELSASRQASAPRSPRNASYAITARLDPGSRTITGDEILTWRNTSNTPASTLRFHLYYNAWRNTASTWMRERRARPATRARVAARSRLGLDRRHDHPPHRRRGGCRRSDDATPLHRTGRRECRGSDGDGSRRSTAPSRPARRSTCRSRGRRACRARSRGPA